MHDITSYVEDRRPQLLRELLDWVAQPSVSSTGEGFPDATQYAIALLERCGLAAQALDGGPTVVGRASAGAQRPRVLIYGHYDVQPPGPLSEWRSPPFAPDVRDGRVFGRGAADNKGQHLAHLLAIRALIDTLGELPCSVTVLLDGEEECGSPDLPALVERNRAELAADVVIWSDGAVESDGSPCLRLGTRGLLTFELCARGGRHPLHSGQWGGVAVNPAWELVHLLASMMRPSGELLVEGATEGWSGLGVSERAALAAPSSDPRVVLDRLGFRSIDAAGDASSSLARLAAPCMTINSLSCDDGEEHRTVIPHVATARCDARLATGQRVERVAAAIRQHVARVAPNVEFRVRGGAMEPSRTSPDLPYTAMIAAGAALGLGREPRVVPAMRGSLPLYVFTGLLGVPCYGLPFANPDAANHAANENFELARFEAAIVAAAGVLLALGKGSEA